MTLFAALPASTSLLAQLANSAARALVLSVIVGLALTAFRVKTTACACSHGPQYSMPPLRCPCCMDAAPLRFLRLLSCKTHPFKTRGCPSKLRLGGVFLADQQVPTEMVAAQPAAATRTGEPSISYTEEVKRAGPNHGKARSRTEMLPVGPAPRLFYRSGPRHRGMQSRPASMSPER